MIRLVLSGLYIGALLMSPIFNSKVVHFGSWQFLSWTPVVALTCGIIDTINQNYGKKEARQTVMAALVIRAVFYLGVFPFLFVFTSPDPLFQQSFRNFAVSQGLTLFARYYVQIPLFTRMTVWFSLKYNTAGFAFTAVKGGLQTLLMFWGTGIGNMWGLVVTETITKYLFVVLGTPVASLLNYAVRNRK